MQQIFIEIVGYAAAIVGTSMMLPQVVKSLRTKKVEDLSILMCILFFLNCVLWEFYGWLLGSWPVIVANFCGIIISTTQLIIKVKYDKKSKKK
jgi:MtN3 and saliva related transmembrane protein